MSMQITSYNSHSASFGPSAVRVNTETVYSARREADLVMTSIGNIGTGPDAKINFGDYAAVTGTYGARQLPHRLGHPCQHISPRT